MPNAQIEYSYSYQLKRVNMNYNTAIGELLQSYYTRQYSAYSFGVIAQ